MRAEGGQQMTTCEVLRHGAMWRVLVRRDGVVVLRRDFMTVEAATAFAEAQEWASNR